MHFHIQNDLSFRNEHVNLNKKITFYLYLSIILEILLHKFMVIFDELLNHKIYSDFSYIYLSYNVRGILHPDSALALLQKQKIFLKEMPWRHFNLK